MIGVDRGAASLAIDEEPPVPWPEVPRRERTQPEPVESAQAEDALFAALFAALIERQSRFVFRVAYAMLRNVEDAEDTVQETFMKLYRTQSWRDIRDERGFLARTTWRVALDRLPGRTKHAATRVAAGSDAPDLAELPSPTANPEQAAVAADSHAAIHRLIDALPEDLRQPLALSSVEELNSREIGKILGISEGTVRTRLMRARKILKQKLAATMEVRHAK
jgi:RNA polymerase sigma-70 factor (ECF subfamily)